MRTYLLSFIVLDVREIMIKCVRYLRRDWEQYFNKFLEYLFLRFFVNIYIYKYMYMCVCKNIIFIEFHKP